MDYLKYDWHPIDVPHMEEMSRALRKSGRDIVYSLSNGASKDSAQAYQRSSNLWRTTGDIYDNWPKVKEIGFGAVQDFWAPYAGPGHWNDLDMLVVGNVSTGKSIHPTQLTPDEQYTHVSLWCLQAAPLDPRLRTHGARRLHPRPAHQRRGARRRSGRAGQAGNVPVGKEGDKVAYVKPMEDGSMAVGLFNLGPAETTVAIKWADLRIDEGKQMTVRDLWRQKDLGKLRGKVRGQGGLARGRAGADQRGEALIPACRRAGHQRFRHPARVG